MEHLQDYIATAQAVQQEQQERLQIEMSDEYKALEEKLKAMTAHIPDSREELKLCENALKEEMTKNGVFEAEGVVVKTRTNKQVDTQILLEELEGDFDAWRSIIEQSPPSQKVVNDFAKTNPQWKKVKRAIVETGTSISSISLSTEL